MAARRVFFEGWVQGVGFRYQTKRLAQGYEVVGWVRNLPDGRVELQAMGDKEELEGFLHSFEQSSLAHHIHEMREETIPDLEGVSGFTIR